MFTRSRDSISVREAGFRTRGPEFFSANGAGSLTSVIDDFSEGSPTSSVIAGTYSISNDGTGSIQFTFPTGSLTYAITLVSSSKVYMTEADTTLSGGGVAEKQDTTAFASAPTGTYIFRRRSLTTGATPTSYVGSLTLNAGAISTGTNAEDTLVFGGTVTSLALNAALFNTRTQPLAEPQAASLTATGLRQPLCTTLWMRTTFECSRLTAESSAWAGRKNRAQ